MKRQIRSEIEPALIKADLFNAASMAFSSAKGSSRLSGNRFQP